MIRNLLGSLLILIFSLSAPQANKDKIDTISLIKPAPFSLTFNKLSQAKFDDKKAEDIAFKVNETKLKGIFSAFKTDSGMVILGGELLHTQYKFTSSSIDTNNLYNLSVPITYITKSTNWKHIGRIAPMLNSDLKNISGDDFSVSGIYIGEYQYSNTLKWIVGAGLGHQFGEQQLFPILGVTYQPNKKVHLNVVFPKLEAFYLPTETFAFYFSARPAGRLWNGERKNNSDDVDIITEETRAAFGGVYSFTQNWSFRAEAGLATARRFKFTTSNGDTFNLNVKDTSFVGLALEYKP